MLEPEMDVIDTHAMNFTPKAAKWLIEQIKQVRTIKFLRLKMFSMSTLQPHEEDQLDNELLTSLQDSVWENVEVCDVDFLENNIRYILGIVGQCKKLRTLIWRVSYIDHQKKAELLTKFVEAMPKEASLHLIHWRDLKLDEELQSIKANIFIEQAGDRFDTLLESSTGDADFEMANFELPELEEQRLGNRTWEAHFKDLKEMFFSEKFEQIPNWTANLSTIKVAVLDSGIDHLHEDFAELLKKKLLTGYSVVPRCDWRGDKHGHGTMCAGLIGGQRSGIAYGVKLDIIRVLGIRKITPDALALGIRNAIERNANIISISLGRKKYDKGVHDAIQEAISRNIIVVCAVGNGGSLLRNNITFPATIASVIRVGSIDRTGAASNFSSVGGPEVDIAALGERIASTYPTDKGMYALMNGTSFAAPLVAGLCALLMCYEMCILPPAERKLVNSHCMKHLLRELCYNTSGEAAKGRGTVNLQKILEVEQLFIYELNNIC